MGIALDSGIALASSSVGDPNPLSLIRAKELAQAKLAEAMEHVALAKAKKLAEGEASQEGTSTVVETSAALQLDPTMMAKCPISEDCAPEEVPLSSLVREKKKRARSTNLPPRENLRMTLARQHEPLYRSPNEDCGLEH
jgi:hypothetical protein